MKGKQILVLSFLALVVFMAALVNKAKADFNFQLPPDAEIAYWPKTGTAPLIVTFENKSQRADSIEWTFWDFVIDESQLDQSANSIVYQYLYPGTFPVYLSATNEAGTDVKVVYVTVLDSGLPSVVAEFIAAPRNGPAGTTVQFINLTAGDFDTYLWDFGDNSSDTNQNPAHVYNAPGLYTVSLTIFSSTSGFFDTETKVNYINIFPSSASMINPDFLATPATGTSPQMVEFSALSAGETGNILWDFGDGTSSELLNPKHVYNDPGRYTVTLFADGQEIAKTDCINILSSVEGQRSPAALVLGNDPAQLSILQNFRDNVLGQTLPGLGLIELYYKHSLELVSILQQDEGLRAEAGDLLRGLLPGVQSVVDGNTMTLTPAQVDAIKAVIGKIATQAGPDLENFLVRVVVELSGGQYLGSLGISVPAAE